MSYNYWSTYTVLWQSRNWAIKQHKASKKVIICFRGKGDDRQIARSFSYQIGKSYSYRTWKQYKENPQGMIKKAMYLQTQAIKKEIRDIENTAKRRIKNLEKEIAEMNEKFDADTSL